MRHQFHSRLTAMLREAHEACREAAARKMPIDEVSEMRKERAARQAVSRRELLRWGGILSASAVAGLPRLAKSAAQPRIVIVGGGLAGIRCAHKLWVDSQVRSTVYEWNTRMGGRVETLSNFFEQSQIVELCGEFVSSEHHSMLALAQRYSLKLDLANIAPGYTVNTYWFNGGTYTQSDLDADWQKFGYQVFVEAVKQAPWPTRYTHYTQMARQWDQMSVKDWIEKYVPGGLKSPFGLLCYEDTVSEYGGPPEQQSALNLIYILGYNDSAPGAAQSNKQPMLAGTNEKYHIHGGNEQIVTGMLDELPSDTVHTGEKLVAVVKNGDGSYTCTFESGSSSHDVTADHLVLAIPFSTLRYVDLSKAGLSPLKTTAIRNLQLGTSAKVHLQFTNRVWYKDKLDASVYADNGASVVWECSNYQQGSMGILADLQAGTHGAYFGEKYGVTEYQGKATPAMADDTLNALEPILPGVTSAFNGLAHYRAGILDPHIRGAWSQYNIGQYTGFSGVEPVQEGNIHFAGEHTSLAYQGYMEGAVTSGERVAGEIVKT